MHKSGSKNMSESVSSDSGKAKKEYEVWHSQEIKKIFELYNDYGSQWKLMAQELPGRAPNSIKNRFYTSIRNLLKLLFREHPNLKKKLPHQIPSKQIRKLYDGKQQYGQFNNFIRNILKKCHFDVCPQNIKPFVQNYQSQILVMFQLIYQTDESKSKASGQKIQPKQEQIEEKHINSPSNPKQPTEIPPVLDSNPGNQQIVLVPHFFYWPQYNSYYQGPF